MKKIISLVIMTVMLVSALAACGGGKESGSDAQKLVIWAGNAHSKNFYLKKTEEFNQGLGKELGIEIEYIVKNDVSKEVDLAFVSGQAPDLMTGNMKKLASSDYIAAFEDIEGGQEYIDKYKDHIVLKKNMNNGKTYSLPLAITTRGLVYNKDMFKAAGIVDENGEALPPVTWDDVIEDAKKLTDPSKQEYGIIFDAKESLWYGENIGEVAVSSGGFGEGYNPYTGEYDFSVQAEVMKKVMQLKQDATYFPGAEGLSNDAARAKFAAGGIGMKMAYSFDYAVLTEQFPAEIDWGVAPLPVLAEEDFSGQFCTFTGNFLINKESVAKFGDEKILKVYDFFQNDAFMIDLFKAGADIPCKYSLIKDVELKDAENWKAFAEMLALSYNPPQYLAHEIDTTGVTDMSARWAEIWAGETSVSEIDRVCAEYAKACNDGKQKYIASHPDYAAPALVSPDYVIYDKNK